MRQTSDIREMTGYALAKVCKAHRSSVGELLGRIGLHAGQEMVLVELWRQDRLRVCELAGRLGVEPPTATRMIQRLEGCGLVVRQRDPDDARSFRVSLTEKGRSLEESVTRCWNEVEEKAFAGISQEECRGLRDLLTRIRNNLETGMG